MTILGRSAGIEPIRRGGAEPNQLIGVTGPLGGSILERHMTFTPRVREARSLATVSRVTAMIDLSDGLSRDVAHVCRESGVGAILWADQIPIHGDARAMDDGRSPLEHALHDGEDYELLWVIDHGFDVSPGVGEERLAAAQFLHLRKAAGLPELTVIGVTTAGPDIVLADKDTLAPLEPKGWEHPL